MRWGLMEIPKGIGDMTSRWVEFSTGLHLDKGDDKWVQFYYPEITKNQWDSWRKNTICHVNRRR